MSPRWSSSRQSAWGASDDSSFSNQTLLLAAIVILLGGIGFGFVISQGTSSENPKSKEDPAVIDSSIAGVAKSEQTPEGAVQAATSLMSGMPGLALEEKDKQGNIVTDLIAPTAQPGVRATVQAVLDGSREKILGPPEAEHAPTMQLITTPITYKVDMIGNTNDIANVQVWLMTVVADFGGSQVESTWTTAQIQLVWTDHWRVASFINTDGPTPPLVAKDAKSSPFEDVVQRFTGFYSYRHATR